MKFKLFNSYSHLKYGLSEKKDGSMKIAPSGHSDVIRLKFFDLLNLSQIVSAKIVHGNKSVSVSFNEKGRVILDADGLVTNEKNLYLTATVADCFPVYFFDPQFNTVGLAHAGWKGIVSGIIPNTLAKLREASGGDTRNILCAIGPGIQKHHFEINTDILDKFKLYQKFITHSEKITVDLPGIIKQQVSDFGVPNTNIEISDECTFCLKDKYFSFRRDRPDTIQAMVAYIGTI